MDAEKAVVESTDMGTWLPLAFKDGYSIEKVTSVTVDGTDVTAKLSKVTTERHNRKAASGKDTQADCLQDAVIKHRPSI